MSQRTRTSEMTAVPANLFSWNYRVLDGDAFVAFLDLSWFRERGTLRVEEREFAIGRENPNSGLFFLREGERTLATAHKSSAFRRHFEVDVEGQGFTLEAAQLLGRAFVLCDPSGREVGSMRPRHAFTRRARVEFPGELSLEVRVFLAWLVILLWKRSAAHGAN